MLSLQYCRLLSSHYTDRKAMRECLIMRYLLSNVAGSGCRIVNPLLFSVAHWNGSTSHFLTVKMFFSVFLKGCCVVLEKKFKTLNIYNINEVMIQTQRYLLFFHEYTSSSRRKTRSPDCCELGRWQGPANVSKLSKTAGNKSAYEEFTLLIKISFPKST